LSHKKNYQGKGFKRAISVFHFNRFYQLNTSLISYKQEKNLMESLQWMPLTFSIIPMKQAITSTGRLDLIALN
jgi:hypothetical protein